MAIKARWKSKDEAPDWAKDHLVEVTDIEGKGLGVFTIDAEGLRPKEHVDGFRESKIQLARQLEELQEKTRGSLSAEQAAELQRRIDELNEQASTADERKIAEKVKETFVPFKLGDREIRVHKGDKGAFETHLKATTDQLTAAGETGKKQLAELRKERIANAGLLAMKAIGGFKDKAVGDVLLHLDHTFTIGGDNFEAFIPDPDDPTKPKVDKDQKKVTVETYLRNIVESGERAGVWVEEAKGPNKKLVPPVPGGDKTPRPTSTDLIKKGIEQRRAAG